LWLYVGIVDMNKAQRKKATHFLLFIRISAKKLVGLLGDGCANRNILNAYRHPNHSIIFSAHAFPQPMHQICSNRKSSGLTAK